MPWITKDDFIESYSKFKQRGANFFLSKLNLNNQQRTKSTFNDAKLQTANWWIIPEVRQRWNEKITGDKNKSYEQYFVENYCKGKSHLKLLSVGSGISNHEIKLAEIGPFEKVICLDITEELLAKAKKKAQRLSLSNIEFLSKEWNKDLFQKDYFDIIMFHQSLHHFKEVPQLLTDISALLKTEGLLLLHEYVGPNRLMWKEDQLKTSNKLLHTIPQKWRIRFKSKMIKKSISGPGFIRMIISDPSEAVDSERILPSLKKQFVTLEEKKLGGNLLTLILKDIAHHFLELDKSKSALLKTLFDAEDQFIEEHSTDLIFGVYRKP